MKATNFRIGNIATVCYDDRKPDTIVVIEPGLIHFSSEKDANDEKDVVGVFLTVEKLMEVDFFRKCKDFNFSIATRKENHVEVIIMLGTFKRSCKYVHQLQNTYWWLTDKELISFKK